jgi:MoxR-like ATPase
MQEQSVSYAGTTYRLDRPFFVLATQNPIEQSGTYPLPEAQLDRFLFHVRMEYPHEAEEVSILARTTGTRSEGATAVLTGDDLRALQQLAREVRASDAMLAYIARLVRATRPGDAAHPLVREWVRWGAGPRAGQALVLGAKARALLAGRFAIVPDDVRALAAPVLRHRVLVNFRAEAEGMAAEAIVARLLADVTGPRSPLD